MRTMRNIVLFLFVFMTAFHLFAQNEKLSSLNVVVKDSITQEPLQYVVVKLMDNNNQLCYGTTTDDSGLVNIEQIACKSYVLITSLVGYKTDTINIDLSGDKKTHYFSISLSSRSVLLPSVAITARSTSSAMGIDCDIFVPDSAQLKSSTTGLDLLDKVPGVHVSKANQIVTFLGGNVLILVNGVNNGRNLNAIDVNDIKQIETIKSPSPEYGSEVNTIINIILKEEQKQGFSTALQLDYYTQNKHNNSNLQLDYNFKKVRIFGMYKLNLQNTISDSETYRWNKDDSLQYEHISKDSDPSRSRSLNHTFQYGFDYRINENNLLNFTGQFQAQDRKSYLRGFEKYYYRNGDMTNWNIANSERESTNKLQNYNLYYRHNFKNPGQQLSITANFYYMSGKSHSNSNSMEYFIPDSSRQKAQSRGEDNNLYSTNIKIDYAHPFSKKISSQHGLQFATRNIREVQYINDKINNSFDYAEYRVMPYFNFICRLKSFSLMAGLNAEMRSFEFVESARVNKWSYVPSLTILYNTKKSGNIKLSYRMQLQHPQYRQLSPFVNYTTDSLMFSTGNPNLKPVKTNILTLNHSYQVSKLYLSTSLLYRYTYDILLMKRTFLDNNVLSMKYENVESSHDFGVSVYGSYKFFKFIVASIDMNFSYFLFPNSEYNGFYYDISPYVEFELPANFSITATATFRGKRRTYNGHFKYSPYIDDISIKKKLMKSRASITLSVLNSFQKRTEFIRWDADYYEHWQSIQNNFCVMLRFNILFNYGKKYNKINRELNMEQETK